MMKFKSLGVILFLSLSGFRDVVPSLNLPKKTLNICYVSLNNKREFGLMREFVEKIESRLGNKQYFNVIEFQEQGKSPEETFKNMVKSGTSCDGVVISGHHTGAFGGSRASGTLRIDTLEKLSCEIENEKWFGEVNSLWLQGCRTLGAEKETAGANDNLAEYHAQRVAQVRAQDGLNQTQTQLENEFATILDSETPYASRFFKTFFNAKIFGWTMTAPGENAQSEKSLLYHVNNVGRRLLLEDKMNIEALEDPTKNEIGEFAAATYFNALVTLLTSSDKKAQIVSSVEGWVDHGKNADPKQRIYGFGNPELKAYPPLMVEGDKTSIRARQMDCGLRRAKLPREIEEAVSDILATPESIAFSFYTIKEVLEERMRDPITRRSVKKSLAGNKNLMDFLNIKINHKHIGVSKKLDYVGLYLLISEDRLNPIIAKILQESATKLMAKIENGNYDRRDEKQWIIKGLIKNNLVTLETLMDWVERSQDDSLVEVIASSMDHFSNERVKMDLVKLVRALLSHPKTTMNAQSSLFFSLTRLPFEEEEVVLLVKDFASKVMAKYEEKKSEDFTALLSVLAQIKTKIDGLEAILEKIYQVIKAKEAYTFQSTTNGVTYNFSSADYSYGTFLRAVSNPVFEIGTWEKYVLEVFDGFSKRNPKINLDIHLNFLLEALDMRPTLPKSMLPILRMVVDRLPDYNATNYWQRVKAIRVLSRAPEMLEVARSEAKKIIEGGRSQEISSLIYSSIENGDFKNLIETEDIEKILRNEDMNLRSVSIYSLVKSPHPNAKAAKLLMDFIEKTPRTEVMRLIADFGWFEFEKDLQLQKAHFKKEFIDAADLNYISVAVEAITVLMKPHVVANPTKYLVDLSARAGFNPYVKGALLFQIIKQPATSKMKELAQATLAAEDFTEESISTFSSRSSLFYLYESLTFKQIKTYLKVVANHSALGVYVKFEMRKNLKQDKRFTPQQRLELLTLLK